MIAHSPHCIDLLLVDAEQPEISRDALAYRVRCEAPEARLVYMSSLPEGEGARAGLGDVEIVQKALGAGELARRIRELLGDDRPSRPGAHAARPLDHGPFGCAPTSSVRR